MSHKLILRLFVVLGCVSLVGAAQAEVDPGKSTLEKLRETRVLTIGVRDAAAPFASIKNGAPQGYTVDICNEVAAGIEKQLKLKLDVKYVPVSATNRIELLRSGAIDLECGTTTDTKAREKEVSFTFPIFITGARLAVRTNSSITDYKNMPGARVVVVAGSSCQKWIVPAMAAAQAHGQAFSVTAVKGNNEGVIAVATNQADAFCTDDVLLAGAIADNNLAGQVHRVSQPLSIEPYALMTRKNDVEFLKMVDDLVADCLLSGKAARLGDKWFDTPALRYKLNSMTTAAFSYPIKSVAYPE